MFLYVSTPSIFLAAIQTLVIFMKRYYKNSKQWTPSSHCKSSWLQSSSVWYWWHLKSFHRELNTSIKLEAYCMFPSHQDIDSILANVFKRHVLRLAPESEDIFRKLKNHNGNYKEDLIFRWNRGFFSLSLWVDRFIFFKDCFLTKYHRD